MRPKPGRFVAELDLALAFMRGDVTTGQVGAVVDRPTGSGARNWVLTTLVGAVRAGMLRLEAGGQ